MSGEDVGFIEPADLVKMLPGRLPLRRGSTGKIYIVSPWSAWHMATPHGQATIKEFGQFPGEKPAGAPPVPQKNRLLPESETKPEPEPEKPAEAARESEPEKRGVFDFFNLGDFD